jgi:hypothetical protein
MMTAAVASRTEMVVGGVEPAQLALEFGILLHKALPAPQISHPIGSHDLEIFFRQPMQQSYAHAKPIAAENAPVQFNFSGTTLAQKSSFNKYLRKF